MKGILSQSEIDDLIKSISDKDVDLDKLKTESQNSKIKTYDFRKPNKFTHEQVKVFNRIFSDFSKFLAMDISDRYRLSCFVDLMFIDEQTFYEYTNSIGKTSVIGILGVPPMKGSIAFELTSGIASVLLNLILGGNGRISGQKPSYTDIELSLSKNILGGFLVPMRDSWDNIVTLEPEVERVETSGQNIQICAPSDTIAIVSLKVTIGEVEGIVNCCIPYTIVEPYIKSMNSMSMFTANAVDSDENNEDILKKVIEDGNVEIICELGKSYLTMDEINKMQAGDVIKLNKSVNEPAEILYNDLSKYTADIGIKNGRYSARILNNLEGTRENG